MELLLDPAALGGLAGLIAVASWAIGRAHASSLAASPRETVVDETAVDETAPPDGSRVPETESCALATTAAPPPAPCQQRALEERRAALAHPFVLAELHAEASAIRRDERVLGPGPADQGLLVLPRADTSPACRFMGLSGQPTCPAVTRSRCGEGHQCHPAQEAMAASGLSHRL